jgi:hypothetical protein
MTTNVPHSRTAAVIDDKFSRDWYDFFRRLDQAVFNSAPVSSNTNTVTVISAGSGGLPETTIVDATTARTLSATDANCVIEFTSSSAVTVTLNAGVFEVDQIVYLLQGGAGQVTLVAGVGVTIDYSDSLKTRTQESMIGVKQIQADKWELYGDAEPVAPALSVLVRAANSSGAPEWLQLTADGHIPKRVSNAIVSAADGGSGGGNSYNPSGW